MANSVIHSGEEVETALKTMHHPHLDTGWVSQAERELVGLKKAMTGVRDELVNNLAKLSKLDVDMAKKHQKLTETNDTEIQQEKQAKIKKLEGERSARPEALSAEKAYLRSQVNRIPETFRKLLHEDTTLGERIKTLFHEQGITIASILTAIGMTISKLALTLIGWGGAGMPTPAPKPSDKGGVKEWVKITYMPLQPCPGSSAQLSIGS